MWGWSRTPGTRPAERGAGPAGLRVAFLIVQRMLPMGEGTGLGLGAALLTAASWVAGRAPPAGRENPSRDQLNGRQLDTAPDDPGCSRWREFGRRGADRAASRRARAPLPWIRTHRPGRARPVVPRRTAAGGPTPGPPGSRSGPRPGEDGRGPQEAAEKNAAAPHSGRPAPPTERAAPPPGGTPTRTTRTRSTCSCTTSSARDRVDGDSTPPAGSSAGPVPGQRLVPAR